MRFFLPTVISLIIAGLLLATSIRPDDQKPGTAVEVVKVIAKTTEWGKDLPPERKPSNRAIRSEDELLDFVGIAGKNRDAETRKRVLAGVADALHAKQIDISKQMLVVIDIVHYKPNQTHDVRKSVADEKTVRYRRLWHSPSSQCTRCGSAHPVAVAAV